MEIEIQPSSFTKFVEHRSAAKSLEFNSIVFKEVRPYAHTIDVLSQKFKNKLVVKKLFEMHVDIPNIELILG